MQMREIPGGVILEKENQEIGRCLFRREGEITRLEVLEIEPRWRRKGYGSYLLREVLRTTGAYRRGEGSHHTAPLPAGELAPFWEKFGFKVQGNMLVRLCRPDPSAVSLTHDFLAARLPRGGFAIDATCGNGHDTEFLCRTVGEEGRVLALDIQAQAVENTRARLAAAGLSNARVEQADHALLASLAKPGSTDAVVFNFGWLPGASHEVFSAAGSSIPALEAALGLLKPGGILCAALYSGTGIGSAEKQAVLAWLCALPLTRYTVLVCEFANWAETAPLPCFVLKK